VGGIRTTVGRRTRGVAFTALAATTFVACNGSSSTSDGTTPAGEPIVTEVGPADALTALVRWQVDETEPVLDEDGEPVLPVMYVVSETGGTIDVGVQAAVVEQTVDDAVVRFADERAEAIDDELEDEPVKDDGVLLMVAELPDAAPSVSLAVVRYRNVEENEALDIEVTAGPTGVDVMATPIPS